MKVFKLAKAELKKIFLRPIMIVALTALVVVTAISTFVFNPSPRNQTYIPAIGTTVRDAYNNFISESNANGKTKIDQSLTEQKNKVVSFIAKLEDEQQLNSLQEKVSLANTAYTGALNSVINYNSGTATSNHVIAAFENLRQKSLDVRAYLEGEFAEEVTFYITKDNYDALIKFFKGISDSIPITYQDYREQFVSEYNFLVKYHSFSKLTPIMEQIKNFEINQTKMDKVIEDYYTNILDKDNPNNETPRLNKLFKTIKTFVDDVDAKPNNALTLQEDLATLTKYISQYKSLATMSASVIKNELLLAKAGDKTDVELKNYVNFEGFNSYDIRQELTFNKYLLDNNLFDYDFLLPFDYNQNSGQATNVFDYMIYSLQICTLVIILFSIFIASGTVANEQSSGTMKMIAIRPYSRPKIVTAKMIAVIYFMMIMLLIAFVGTFAIGYYTYGLEQLNVLAIFNGQTPIILNAFVLLGIYFLSIVLQVSFYIILSTFFSVAAKSGTLSLILSILVFAFAFISNTMLIAQTWFQILPFTHLDLYKFFGVKSAGGMFGFNLPIDANFQFSLIYLLSINFVFFLLANSVFRKRNIA